MVSAADTGPITRMLRVNREQVQVDMPVVLAGAGHKREGRIRVVGLDTLFVECGKPGEVAGKLEVRMSIPLHQGEVPIRLICDVVLAGKDFRSGAEGVALNIVAVHQEKKPGIFERYVKFLYYRAMSGQA